MFRASIRDHECSEDCQVGEPAGVDENGHQLVKSLLYSYAG